MSHPIEIKMGSSITFRDSGSVAVGTVNDPPFLLWDGDTGITAYVPVHVSEGNKNQVVHGANIVAVD